MTTLVFATAGHVDHGKSTLVHALTGTDPDRLPEEKRRGLTIELGFARLPLSDDDDIHFIDVPGHVRFVGTMLAGVGAIDACLFVVAATEGWMAQSEEHLRILELLGAARGVVAVTMADLVDDAAVAKVVRQIGEAVAGTFVQDGPVVVVDSVSGRGLTALRAALLELAAEPRPEATTSRARMWIDRSFSLPGAGTVVTGTLTGGSLTVGDEVLLVTRRGDRRARVRALESFGVASTALAPGRRAAVSLSGIGHRELRRGDALVRPDEWHLTDTVDASLDVLGDVPRALRSTGAHAVHVGSDEAAARLQVLGGRQVAAGERGLVRLRLPRRVPLAPGDRYVLRDAGSASTVGGGEILDVAPVLRPSKAQPDRDVARVVAERGWVRADELERLTGVAHPPTVGDWVVDPAAEAASRSALRDAVDGAGEPGLDLASLDEQHRALVDTDAELEVRHARVHRVGARDPFADHPYLEALRAAPFQPPSPEEAGASPGDARELVRRGLVIREGNLFFSADAARLAAQAAAELLGDTSEGFTLAELRARLGTSRRFALALVTHLDREGVTRRRGDLRIGGPRLPPLGERSG